MPLNLKDLITTHERRLQRLKERQAVEGRSTSPEILIEIEDIEEEIGILQGQLRTPVSTSSDIAKQIKGIERKIERLEKKAAKQRPRSQIYGMITILLGGLLVFGVFCLSGLIVVGLIFGDNLVAMLWPTPTLSSESKPIVTLKSVSQPISTPTLILTDTSTLELTETPNDTPKETSSTPLSEGAELKPPTGTPTSLPLTNTPTPTNTSVPPSPTNTPVPPSPTNTPVPPPPTNTPVPPPPTNTPKPPPSPTNTPLPPTNTPTNTPVPPTITIIDPQNGQVIACTNPPSEEACRFTVQGKTEHAYGGLRIFTFVKPINPPGPGWFIQLISTEPNSNGDWTQSATYLGGDGYTTKTGDTLEVRAALVQPDASYNGTQLSALPVATWMGSVFDIDGDVAVSEIVPASVDREP